MATVRVGGCALPSEASATLPGPRPWAWHPPSLQTEVSSRPEILSSVSGRGFSPPVLRYLPNSLSTSRSVSFGEGTCHA